MASTTEDIASVPCRWYYKKACWNLFAICFGRKRKSMSITKLGSDSHSQPHISSSKFQSTTVHEQLFFLVGVFAAILMGILTPFNIVAFGEFTNLMIARQSNDSIISNNFLLQLFGGGSTNSSGTYEDRMDRLLQDSVAYALSRITITAIQFFCGLLSIYLLNYSAQKKVGRMRRYFLKAMLHQDMSWHDTQNTGGFATKFTDSLESIQEGVGEKVGMFTYLITTYVASVILSMFYGWELTLVMTTMCPVLVIVTVLVARIQTRLTKEEEESNSNAGAVVEEVLSNIRTVVAFGGEEKEVERYSAKMAPAKRVGTLSGVYLALGSGTTWMLVFFAYSLAFWYGTPLILRDRDREDQVYTPAVLLIILTGIIAGATNLGFCTPHLEVFAKAKGAFESVIVVLKRKPAIDVNAGGVKIDSKLGDIEFKDVHFTYPARPDVKILNGLSFKVRAGENVALVGRSGSGKSTTIQLIERFYDPDSGSVNINGVDLKSIDLKWMRSQIGLVGQEPVLFNTTIKENICCDLKVSRAEMEKAAHEANAHDFISKLPLGYSTMVGERGAQLSGGQKQRIAIARALLRRPSVLLLDEATSALDVANEAVVQSALERASRGRTTITISHRLSSIRHVDRILVIAGGRLVEDGTHAELMALQEQYYSLVTTDVSLEENSRNDPNKATTKQSNGYIPTEEADTIPKEPKRKEEMDEEEYKAPVLRILGLNNPEWPYVLAGSLASFFNGCLSPASAVFFGNMFGALSYPNDNEVISTTNGCAIAFIIVGVLALICVFIQISSLTLAGVRMTSRLRENVFRAMVSQDMAWFDDERHAVGSLCAKLSGDTSTVQGYNMAWFEDERHAVGGLCAKLSGDTSTVQGKVIRPKQSKPLYQISSLTLAGVRMTSRLRENVFQAMVSQDIAWFDDERHAVGSLCAKLSGDTSTVQGATGSKLGTILQGISTLGAGTILSIFYSWKMTIMCLMCVPFIIFSIVLEGHVMQTEGSTQKQAMEDATKIAVEAMMSVRTIHSLGLEAAVLERYTRKLVQADLALRRKTRFRGLVFAFGQTCMFFSFAISNGFGGYLIARHGEPYKNIIIVSEALLVGAFMLAQVVSFVPNFQLARIAAGRLFKILDRKPHIYSTSGISSTNWRAEGDIKYCDVHFAYPKRPDVKILQGLQLSIARSRKVALVGPSGCGKSTCVQLLQRFYDPISGKVKIDNINTVDVPLRNLRADLGIVSQEPVLFDRTIAENIAYGDNTRTVTIDEIISAAKQANLHSFISSLPAGYETSLGSKGTQLSGGQKQRIAIARSLVRNPRILILDEATSALDSQSEKIVQEALDGASEGRTCIVIAHRLSTVTNADVICVIHRGTVVERGSHTELLALGGHYAQLLQSQQS